MATKSSTNSKKVQKNSTENFRCDTYFSEKLQELSDSIGFSKTVIILAALDYFFRLRPADQVKLVGFHKICEALRIDPDAIEDFEAEIGQLLPIALTQGETENGE